MLGKLTGKYPAWNVRLECDVRVGTQRIVRPIVNLWPGDMLLSRPFLKRFVLSFDQQAGVLWMYRESSEPVRSRPLRTTGLRLKYTDGGMLVTGLLPGFDHSSLPVKSGDVIVSIQGHSADTINGSKLKNLLEANRVLDLKIRRHGRVLDIRLPLKVAVE